MKKFFADFKTFISRGNVLDMAVGVIVGGAFQKIVSSLVNDIIMPLISGIVGVDIRDWIWQIHPPVCEASSPCLTTSPDITKAAVVLRYGLFIQTIIDFLIIAFALFIVIKTVGVLGRKRKKIMAKLEAELIAKRVASEVTPEVEVTPVPEVEEKVTSTQIELLAEIRDLLKK